MNKSLTLLLALVLLPFSVSSETVVRISDPEHWEPKALSAYVGQTVTFSVPFYVCDNSSGLTVAPRRLYSPTNQELPGSDEYEALRVLNSEKYPTLSGVSGYHRMGERIHNLRVRVNSTTSLTYVSGTWVGNSRLEMQEGPNMAHLDMYGKHQLLVCGFNLEYYLTEAFDPYSSMGPDDSEEHQLQREKVGQALTLINADLFGFVEVQQGPGALREIAQDLTTHTGRRFDYVTDGSAVDGTYTKSGYVYCSDVIEPVYPMVEVEAVVKHRKKIMLFRVRETGEQFIFSINHFKAKSGSASGLDADQGDGQGLYNSSRKREAQEVLARCQTFAQSVSDPDILIMGDLNAYAKEDPITTFTRAGLYDLHRYCHADSSYSYTFHGQAGYLDHAICSPSLLRQVTGMTAFHINSDENDRYTYDKSNDGTMFRCSDHDPVIVGLALDSTRTSIPEVYVNSLEVLTNRQNIIIRNADKPEYPAWVRMVSVDGRELLFTDIHTDEYEVALPTAAGVYIVIVYAGNQQVYRSKVIVP
ncbi:MAG: hypothetical protein IJ581_01660 [Paludibacteraceae bacterium]|nr:hypothetical protein [Paludibacteraceae bacterium]